MYLPTAGKDAEFVRDLVILQETVDDTFDEYPDALMFIRGDANAACPPRHQNKRDELLRHFLENNRLSFIPLNHSTYHHFTNNGLSDSSIDVIMGNDISNEYLNKVLCGKTNPVIDSSHDAILSTFLIPQMPHVPQTSSNITAPKIEHTKHKVEWSEEGITEYKILLSSVLPSLHDDYLDVAEPEAVSVLLQVTNHVLTEAAKLTNKTKILGKEPKPRKATIPSYIRNALKAKNDAIKLLENSTDKEAAKILFKEAKSAHQKLVRKHNVSQQVSRDNKLLELLSKQPKEIFKAFRNNKSGAPGKLNSLTVGDKTYTEDKVSDGFFDNISQLKTLTEVTSPSFQQFSEDYRHITAICKAGSKIPRINDKQAEALLRKIRPGVSDFYSITAAHFINGGALTIRHFKLLVNTVIENIEVAGKDELNKVHAVILHKGHKKDKSLASSYRTISSCPFVAKAIEIYLGDLSKEEWKKVQAPTQFQGPGMSHEMASLLLTSAIQDSLNSDKPLFVLLLDAKSAFDLVIREILVRRLFLDSAPDQRVRYWDLRLTNRTTFCQWENQTMGPIKDELGIEQGGPNGSEYWKIYNNEQLSVAQESGLGASISGIPAASVGQADDTALLSHDLHQLQCLLDLSLLYCQKHQVQLSAGKTKLLVFSKSVTDYVKYSKLLMPLHIGDLPIKFATSAEHVGVLRDVAGNLPHVHQRMVSHRGALAKILCMGLARKHRANPLASLRAETIFATPVLYSGMASLFLTKTEISTLAQYVKETTERLLKLYPKTPEPVVFFLAGRLPGEALLHQKQLTLFAMVCNLPGNILHTIALQILTHSSEHSKNWFVDIRNICFTYNLPHPLTLLKHPPKKHEFKALVKANITDFWQSKLRAHSATLESLKYFKPHFMSLSHPHPMWLIANTSYKVNKCITVARMISGRFRCGSLIRHFYPHISGICELCHEALEDLPHILVPHCPLLKDKADHLLAVARDMLALSQIAANIFYTLVCSEDDHKKVQFLLDPSTFPEVIAAEQNEKGTLALLLGVTTMWCYSLNKLRTKLLRI